MGVGASLSQDDLYKIWALVDAEDLITKLRSEDIEAKIVGSLEYAAFDEDNDDWEYDENTDVDIAVKPKDFPKAQSLLSQWLNEKAIPTTDYHHQGKLQECKLFRGRGERKMTIHLIGSLGIL